MNKQPVACKQTHKRLANIDKDAIYLWCNRCNTEHRFSREVLNHMWQSLEEGHDMVETSTSEQRVLY